ncbi:MAG: hypothetical protein GDA49_06785 [Rhodospirillales bacterium]|nr:hypothetical protein [Rhodospirillales bacterium]
MNKLLNVAAGMFLLAAVSACSFSGSNNNSPTPETETTTPEPAPTPETEPVTVSLGAIPPGADNDVTIGLSQYSTADDALKAIEEAIGDGLAAPDALPPMQGTLKGYVRVDLPDDRVLGNLTIDANFDQKTLTTKASDFVRFDVSGPTPVVFNKELTIIEASGEGSDMLTGMFGHELDGSLSGTGTIDSTAMTMTGTLDGTLSEAVELSGTLGSAEVNSVPATLEHKADLTLEGNVYDNDGPLLVHGGVTGNVVTTAKGVTPSTDIPIRRQQIESDSAFYATQDSTIGLPEYRMADDALKAIEMAISDGLAAPAALPQGRGTLTGYVRVDLPGNRVLGNLTIDASFDDATFTTEASNFARFDVSDPAAPTLFNKELTIMAGSDMVTGAFQHVLQGSLTGTGTIDSTAMTMTGKLEGTLREPEKIRLDGDLPSAFSPSAIINLPSDVEHKADLMLEGKVYDNQRMLLVHGGVTGNVETTIRTPDAGKITQQIESSSAFYASAPAPTN